MRCRANIETIEMIREDIVLDFSSRSEISSDPDAFSARIWKRRDSVCTDTNPISFNGHPRPGNDDAVCGSDDVAFSGRCTADSIV